MVRAMFRLLAVLSLAVSLLLAQTETGSLDGRITDPSGGTVPNAAISVKNLGTAVKRSVSAPSDGASQVTLLPPGLYEVTVEAIGFRPFVDHQVRVPVAQAAVLNVPTRNRYNAIRHRSNRSR